MLKKQNVFLIGCIIMGTYGVLLKEKDFVISAFIQYISMGICVKSLYPMTTCRNTPTSNKVGDNGSYVPG